MFPLLLPFLSLLLVVASIQMRVHWLGYSSIIRLPRSTQLESNRPSPEVTFGNLVLFFPAYHGAFERADETTRLKIDGALQK